MEIQTENPQKKKKKNLKKILCMKANTGLDSIKVNWISNDLHWKCFRFLGSDCCGWSLWFGPTVSALNQSINQSIFINLLINLNVLFD